MLINPKHGWVTISIENWSDRASYLTEVPLECLDNMIYALENGSDFIVSFDAEGWTYKIISDYYRTFVITELDTCDLIVFENVSKKVLAKEIFNDITKDIDEWSMWSCSLDYDNEGHVTQESIDKYRNTLLSKLEKLEKLLK